MDARPAFEHVDAMAGDHPDDPDAGAAWSESVMSHRLREAIASVRRISIDGSPDASERASEHPAPRGVAEQPALWEAPEEVAPSQPSEDEAPAPVAAAGRRGVRIAALVIASATVLLVGSGLGVLLAGWRLELPSLPIGTAPPPEPAAETPPPITETLWLQRSPLPPAAAMRRPSPGLAPLPPPPKPAPSSTVPPEQPPATDPITVAIDALLRETEGSDGPVEPLAAEDTAAPATPKVFVHYSANVAGGPAAAMDLVRHLEAAGFAVEARRVAIPIPAPSVRYFFAADRDEAEALGSSLEGQLPGGTTPAVVDFTRHDPKPPPGNLEVWIPS
jgi:hypothetical protein